MFVLLTIISSPQSSAQTISCNDPELKDLQYNPDLKVKQQVDSIVLADPEIKKIINASTYCEIMSISTIHEENGPYQGLNINLNNTKNLVVLVSLQNNSVVSYELVNLTRDYPTIEASPFNFILPYTIIGAGIAGIFVVVILIRKNKKHKEK